MKILFPRANRCSQHALWGWLWWLNFWPRCQNSSGFSWQPSNKFEQQVLRWPRLILRRLFSTHSSVISKTTFQGSCTWFACTQLFSRKKFASSCGLMEKTKIEQFRLLPTPPPPPCMCEKRLSANANKKANFRFLCSLNFPLTTKENGKVNRESYYTFSFKNPPHFPFHISGRFICTRLLGVLICCEIFNELLCSNVLPTPLFIVFAFSPKVYRLLGWRWIRNNYLITRFVGFRRLLCINSPNTSQIRQFNH